MSGEAKREPSGRLSEQGAEERRANETEKRRESGAEERSRSKAEAKQERRREGIRKKVSGDNSERDPPVPIPNTEVKPLSAEGTWLATAREIRTSPDSKREGELEKQGCFSNLFEVRGKQGMRCAVPCSGQ